MAINKTPIFVAKTRNYDIFVAKIYDCALIDSFWGFPRLIDSPTSYITLQPTDILFKSHALFWSTCLVSGIASLILAGMKSLVAININKIYFKCVSKYLSNTFANIFGNIFCPFAKIVPTWAQLLPRRSALCWLCWGGKEFEGKSSKDIRKSDGKQIIWSLQEKVT